MNPDYALRQMMEELENQHKVLVELVAELQPPFIGFDIQTISKEDEPNVIANGIDSLNVGSLSQWHHLHKVLGFWSKYYKEDGVSTQFVERMPGIVVVSSSQERVRILVNHINGLKKQIAEHVRHGRNHVQRHEFIHAVFPMIMTDQLYRKIHIIEQNVHNMWFNWTSRPIPKSLTTEKAIALLEKHKDRPLGLTTSNEWQAMIRAQIEDIQNGMYSHIQVKKDFRLLPVLTYKYDTEDGLIKRQTKNGCTPIILLGQNNPSLPIFTHLENFERPALNSMASLDKTPGKVYINTYLKLIGTKYE